MAPSAFSFGASAAGSPFSADPRGQPSSSSSSSNLFSSNKSYGGSHEEVTANGHANSDEDENEELDVAYLEPVAYARSGKAKWTESGRSAGIAVSPAGGEIASWIAKKVRRQLSSSDFLSSFPALIRS